MLRSMLRGQARTGSWRAQDSKSSQTICKELFVKENYDQGTYYSVACKIHEPVRPDSRVPVFLLLLVNLLGIIRQHVLSLN
eukprot:scaffold208863_cov48-Prasinocladus_malaysianus.AAC.2